MDIIERLDQERGELEYRINRLALFLHEQEKTQTVSDEQINKWIAKHPDCIIVDVKLQSNVVDYIDSCCVVRDALVIYQEYEK